MTNPFAKSYVNGKFVRAVDLTGKQAKKIKGAAVEARDFRRLLHGDPTTPSDPHGQFGLSRGANGNRRDKILQAFPAAHGQAKEIAAAMTSGDTDALTDIANAQKWGAFTLRTGGKNTGKSHIFHNPDAKGSFLGSKMGNKHVAHAVPHEQAHADPRRSQFRMAQVMSSPRKQGMEEGRADFLAAGHYQGKAYKANKYGERPTGYAMRAHASNDPDTRKMLKDGTKPKKLQRMAAEFGMDPLTPRQIKDSIKPVRDELRWTGGYKGVHDRMRAAGTKVKKMDDTGRMGSMGRQMMRARDGRFVGAIEPAPMMVQTDIPLDASEVAKADRKSSFGYPGDKTGTKRTLAGAGLVGAGTAGLRVGAGLRSSAKSHAAHVENINSLARETGWGIGPAMGAERTRSAAKAIKHARGGRMALVGGAAAGVAGGALAYNGSRANKRANSRVSKARATNKEIEVNDPNAWRTIKQSESLAAGQRRKKGEAQGSAFIAGGGAVLALGTRSGLNSTGRLVNGVATDHRNLKHFAANGEAKGAKKAMGFARGIGRSAKFRAVRSPLGVGILGAGTGALALTGKARYHEAKSKEHQGRANERRKQYHASRKVSKMLDTNVLLGMTRTLEVFDEVDKASPDMADVHVQGVLRPVKRMGKVSKEFGRANKRALTGGAIGTPLMAGGASIGGMIGAGSSAKKGKGGRTAANAFGRQVVESTGGAVAGQIGGRRFGGARGQVAGGVIGGLAGTLHGTNASVNNSRRKGYLKPGF